MVILWGWVFLMSEVPLHLGMKGTYGCKVMGRLTLIRKESIALNRLFEVLRSISATRYPKILQYRKITKPKDPTVPQN